MKNALLFILALILFQACESVNPVEEINSKIPILPQENYKYNERKLPTGAIVPTNNVFDLDPIEICGTSNCFGSSDSLRVDNEMATLGRVLVFFLRISNPSISTIRFKLQFLETILLSI